MRTKNLLFIASLAMTTCSLFSCGDDDEVDEPIPTPTETKIKFNGYEASTLNLDGITTVQCVSNLKNTRGSFIVTKDDAIKLNEQNVNGLLFFINDFSETEAKELGENINFEGKEFSKKVASLLMYPHELSFTDGVDVYITDGELKNDFKDLDIAVKYAYDNSDVKTSTNTYLTFKTLNTTLKYFVLNGTLEQVKKDTVSYKIESNNGEIAIKYGVEVNTNNDFVLNAVRELLGTKELSSFSTKVESSKTISQEVVTFKLTSGKRSFEVKAYGKAF